MRNILYGTFINTYQDAVWSLFYQSKLLGRTAITDDIFDVLLLQLTTKLAFKLVHKFLPSCGYLLHTSA